MNNADNLQIKNNLAHSLGSKLWHILDKMRGGMDISSSKELFSAIFLYKYLSDNFKEDNSDGYQESNSYYIPSDYTFENIINNQRNNLYDALNLAFERLEHSNKNKLSGIFSSMDFQFEHIFGDIEGINNQLFHLMNEFSAINLTVDSQSGPGLIVDSFQFVLDKFAEAEGKKNGEWTTPPSVRELISNLFRQDLKLPNTIKVYDPVCGSAGLLLQFARDFLTKHSRAKIDLFGQERNLKSVVIAKINLIINGYDISSIKYGDTLLDPKHIENNALQKFDIVIGNPPFSMSNWGADNMVYDTYNRFGWGIPPKSKANYAFILHMLASTKQTGKIAVVVPHGVLFREGNEGAIRRRIIEENYLDAVIVLPPNLFYSTSIPVSILVLDKGRKAKNRNVLFIDAGNLFVVGKRQNKLSTQHINLISDTYGRFKSEDAPLSNERLSCIISPDEIIKNDYNLNISRYLKPEQEFKAININQLEVEITQLEKQLEEVNTQISILSKELFKNKTPTN